jgi:class 3 adenylate cyclase
MPFSLATVFNCNHPSHLFSWVDRFLPAEPAGLEQRVARLIPELAACTTPQELVELVGNRLSAILDTQRFAIYLEDGDRYLLAFERPKASHAQGFAARSSLVGSLRSGSEPVFLEERARRKASRQIHSSDREVLEDMGAAVLIAARRSRRLAGIFALGPRRGGRRYRSRELDMLVALASHLAGELHHIREAQLLRAQQRTNESLQTYVPGVIADWIGRGLEMSCGEREVSVLFVDIHGYTGYAERLTPDQIFSLINGYTRRVSQIIHDHGGAIVEFNGDGMMAVFGAPGELPGKERAAVAAARSLVSVAASIRVVSGNGPVSIGVGVATGTAFVGNIQAVDRMIWSAIGNTTNLAARLQSLTHELRVSIVIDAPTWKHAGPGKGGFSLHRNTPIRGRTGAVDVYAFPLEAA